MKKFIVSKFAGLQAYSWQLYYQMNFITGIFGQHFKPPPCSPIIDLSPLPCSQHLWETVGGGDWAAMPYVGPGQSPGGNQAAKLLEAPRI